jgi:hypothetical protein
MKEIEKEDLDRLAEFEKTILNLQGEDSPLYNIDYEMEAQIRYDVLIDLFEVSDVFDSLKQLDISKDDLWNHLKFIEVYDYLTSKK